MNHRIAFIYIYILIYPFMAVSEMKISTPIIDFEIKYPEKDLYLKKSILKTEYIPLETHDDALIKYCHNIAISDKYIVVIDNGTNSVYTFDRNTGKYLCKVDRYGAGPEDYSLMAKACVDLKNMEVYIWDNPSAKRIMVYSLDGVFKRSIDVTTEHWPNEIVNYNSGQLLVYSDKHPYRYFLVNKKNGKHLKVNIKKGGKGISNLIERSLDDNHSSISMIDLNRIVTSGKDVIISDLCIGPIYKVNNGKLIPLFLRKNMENDSKGYISYVSNVINEYIIINVFPQKKDSKTGKMEIAREGIHQLCYNSKSGEIFRIGKIDTSISELCGVSAPQNVNASGYTIDVLDFLHKRNKLSEDLEKVYKEMSLESNPLIRIVTFK